MDPNTLSDFFSSYGWRYERTGPGLYRTGFEGDTGAYTIWIRIHEHWIYFTINPFVSHSHIGKHAEKIYRQVLDNNHELNMAKFAVDDEGDILITVEFPREGFLYTHFADALTALSHYADAYWPKFEALGASKNVSKGD